MYLHLIKYFYLPVSTSYSFQILTSTNRTPESLYELRMLSALSSASNPLSNPYATIRFNYRYV